MLTRGKLEKNWLHFLELRWTSPWPYVRRRASCGERRAPDHAHEPNQHARAPNVPYLRAVGREFQQPADRGGAMPRTPRSTGPPLPTRRPALGPVPSVWAGRARLSLSRPRPRMETTNAPARLFLQRARTKMIFYQTSGTADRPHKTGRSPPAVYRAGLIVPCPRGAGC